jgi:hypothetical protein
MKGRKAELGSIEGFRLELYRIQTLHSSYGDWTLIGLHVVQVRANDSVPAFKHTAVGSQTPQRAHMLALTSSIAFSRTQGAPPSNFVVSHGQLHRLPDADGTESESISAGWYLDPWYSKRQP